MHRLLWTEILCFINLCQHWTKPGLLEGLFKGGCRNSREDMCEYLCSPARTDVSHRLDDGNQSRRDEEAHNLLIYQQLDQLLWSSTPVLSRTLTVCCSLRSRSDKLIKAVRMKKHRAFYRRPSCLQGRYSCTKLARCRGDTNEGSSAFIQVGLHAHLDQAQEHPWYSARTSPTRTPCSALARSSQYCQCRWAVQTTPKIPIKQTPSSC